MVDISELEKRRFKFLKGVYDASEGVAGRTLNAAALQEALGFDGAETWKIMLYLTKQGLTKVGNGWVEITHQGMLEVEAAHRRPDQPTEHFESEAFRSVVNVYGPVGALMTGAGATASVVQNLSGTDRAEILKALEEFRQSIATASEVSEQLRREVIELVDDGRRELSKETPNGLRLTGTLTGIAIAIQTAGALQPAYGILKAALVLFGINLP